MKSIEQAAREWWPLRVKELEATAINPGSVFPQSESELIKDLAAFHQHMLSKAPSEAVQGTALTDEEQTENVAAAMGYGPVEHPVMTSIQGVNQRVHEAIYFTIGYLRDHGYLSPAPPSRDALDQMLAFVDDDVAAADIRHRYSEELANLEYSTQITPTIAWELGYDAAVLEMRKLDAAKSTPGK